jgi:putative ABC transport system permease protein
MMRFLPLIVKNSLRSRRRTLLTVLSIGASLCLLGVLMAFYYAFYLSETSADQALRLVTRNRVSLANSLPLSYMPKIRQVPGVREVMVFQWFGGTYKDSRDPNNFFARFAVEQDKLFAVYPEYRTSEEEKAAFVRERTACIIGRKLADRLNLKLGDRVILQGDIFPVNLELTVRAIYDAERDNENMIFHYDYLKEAMSGPRGEMVSTFVIRADRAEDVPSISEAVDAMFRNSTVQTKTESERAFELSFLAFLGNVKLFLLSVCSAVTFTILLVSGNTMAMSVRERVREVGILKTLGFTPGAILGVIVAESIVISLIGGVLGLLLAAGICGALRRAPSLVADMSRISIPPPVVVFSLLVAALIGVVSSFVPAWSASRRSIVECLRFTD